MIPEETSQRPPEQDWAGTSRYEVVRRIGRGGMGIVYEAFDRERRQLVALKTLLHFSPEALYLFKNEFRTLADVHHRNLVRLYELVLTESQQVFFAMELVRGTDFLTHVAKPGARRRSDGPSGAKVPRDPVSLDRPTPRSAIVAMGARAVAPIDPSPADLDRLRPALAQLVEGVRALHDAGKMHRDIKPSNVMVNDEGRVVLLDFGVATEVARAADSDAGEYETVGTANYMAPEQALASETPTLASDWYSVGVMLFEALVGRKPFTGSTVDVLTMKNMTDPPPPSACVTGVPADLDNLCVSLLRRDAELRPTSAQILRRLRGPGAAAGHSLPPAAPDEAAAPLIGRESQLRVLREAFDATRAGRSVTVRVGGRSGMGKSSLLQHFLDSLVDGGEAVVLRGRAYEREAMPYKAVDSVIDALSRLLLRLGEEPDTLLLPKEIGALAHLFTVLRRVPAIGEAAAERIDDPQRMRRRAFGALRELLSTLALRRPLVVFIDDVQWGDTDSVALLLDLLRPPSAPPILIVLAYREEEADAPFVTEMRARWPRAAEAVELSVGPLELEDARRLAMRCLGSDDAAAQEIASAVARESEGNPFLVEELARSISGVQRVQRVQRVARPAEDRGPLGVVTLDQMVGRRLLDLPDEARRVLEIVALGGRPLPVSLVHDAAGSGATGDLISLLRERRFVRVGLRDGREFVESIHDRIRETIVAQLPAPAVRDGHGQIARVLLADPHVDPEAIATHLMAAGEADRAGEFAERAAEQAAEKLAFDQAARLLRVRLETAPESSPDGHRLRVRLGQMLEWAGRSDEAGRLYLSAAASAPADRRTDLERAAAAQLLAAGHIDEGAEVIRRVLVQVGVKPPASALGAIFWLVVYRVLAMLTGVKFTPRVATVPERVRARLETLNTASMGYAIVDTILAGCMQSQSVLEALRGGDRFQVARAAGLEGAFIAAAGKAMGSHERKLFDLSERLTQEDGTAEARTAFLGAKGFAKFMRGDWREAVVAFDAARAATPAHLAAYQANTNLFACYALLFLGELKGFEERQVRLLAEAEDRGDLYTSVQLRVGSPTYIWLAHNEPETARRHAREAMAQWSHARYLTQHWQAMYSEASIELFVGDGVAAYARLVRDERPLKKTMLAEASGHLRVLTLFLRGRSAIASAAAHPATRAPRLAEARRLAGRLEREGLLYARVFGTMLGACSKNAAGDATGAATTLRLAVALAEEAEMPVYAAACRSRLGMLAAGGGGTELRTQCQTAMTEGGVVDPERFTGMLLPGRWPG